MRAYNRVRPQAYYIIEFAQPGEGSKETLFEPFGA